MPEFVPYERRPDANAISVSFDQTVALRIRDGARLKAVFCERRPTGWGNCSSCDAQSLEGAAGCYMSLAHRTRFCNSADRRDLNTIYWKEEKDA